jgi:LysR family hydrogen peroxide-inducible transcriptional activator
MTKITLRHLRYFDALARHRHFGRAAEASSISQPALSLQIRELEEILGATLVERGARQIRVTALGEEFSLRAREVLRARWRGRRRGPFRGGCGWG